MRDAVLITAAFVLIGTLFFIGWRVRPKLQLPPRFPSGPPPFTPGERRLAAALVFGRFLVAYPLLFAGALTRSKGLMIVGIILVVAILTTGTAWRLRRTRSARRGVPSGPRPASA